MAISKVTAEAPVKPKACPTRMRWPVEETGKNSVNPSTMPSMMAVQMSIKVRASSARGAGLSRAGTANPFRS
jgi:hypothetical protein